MFYQILFAVWEVHSPDSNKGIRKVYLLQNLVIYRISFKNWHLSDLKNEYQKFRIVIFFVCEEELMH